MRILDSCAILLLISNMLFLLPETVLAKQLQLGGSLKSLNIYGEEALAGSLPDYRLSSNHVRLELNWQSALTLDAAIDYLYLWSDPANFYTLADRNFNRQFDLEKNYDHDSAGASLLQLDHFSLKWSQGPVDVTVGRQPVGFGRILIFSPLDVIAPFAPDAIDTDVRSGIDALQTIFHYGLDGQLGVIGVLGSDSRYDSLLATWVDNRQGLDFLLIGGQLRGRNMLGAGIAGSLGTLGVKGELAIYRGRDINIPGEDLYTRYTIGAIEGWYRFDNGLSLIAQYLYNGPGANEPADYPRVLVSAPVQEGLTYLLGKHYLLVAPSYEIHPLVNLQGLAIINFRDESILFRPLVDISLADNVSLQLFWTANFGDNPTVTSTSLPPTPRSEFGLRGDSGGVFVKFFF